MPVPILTEKRVLVKTERQVICPFCEELSEVVRPGLWIWSTKWGWIILKWTYLNECVGLNWMKEWKVKNSQELIGLRDQSLWWSRRVCWDGLGMLNVMILSTESNHDVWQNLKELDREDAWRRLDDIKDEMESIGLSQKDGRWGINGEGESRGNWLTLPSSHRKVAVKMVCMCTCVHIACCILRCRIPAVHWRQLLHWFH